MNRKILRAVICVNLIAVSAVSVVIPTAFAQPTQPLVAIHDSELNRAGEFTPAVGATPTGPGTTGNQWWPTDWHYLVMPEAMKEALRSDGTAFTVVGDSNITAGVLLTNGAPRIHPRRWRGADRTGHYWESMVADRLALFRHARSNEGSATLGWHCFYCRRRFQYYCWSPVN